jgi:hypothetical protein
LTKDVYDSLVAGLTTSDLSPTVTDPITGKPIKKVRGDLSGLDSKIKNRYEELLASETRVPLTSAIKLELRAQASEEVFSENKDNLFMALNLMNLSALSLQHKHNVEDLVNMALTYVPNSQVRVGNDYVDSAGNPVAEKYIDNMKEMIEHFLDMSYYSEGKKDTSSTLFKVRSKKERERAKVLQERLAQPGVTAKQQAAMENELGSLGKRVTLDVLSRKLLDFIRIKGLGWNIPAAIANLTYGKLTNLYKAVDGRLFNTRELGKAERLMLSENKKFNHVVENYSILGDILFEFKDDNKFEEKKNWFFKSIKSLKPYALQTGTEKSNQGSIMIAMMLRQKVKNSDTGEELSMWDAINKEGKLDDTWVLNNRAGNDAVVEMVSRIKSQVEEIHGDYSNPLMIKRTLPGQALGMFKMWFFEAVHNRIGAEREDYVRGITTKGRWRTMAQLLKSHKLQFRKLYKDYKNGKLSEVDAANMRVNLLEFAAYVLSTALYGLMKAGICGDSKTCQHANASQLFVLNTTKRLSNEISFWVPGPHSLKEWYKFITNPTAAANLLNDMYNLVEVVGVMVDDDQENDYYTKGFYEGRHKGMVWVEKQLPAINQLQRVRKYGSEFLNL